MSKKYRQNERSFALCSLNVNKVSRIFTSKKISSKWNDFRTVNKVSRILPKIERTFFHDFQTLWDLHDSWQLDEFDVVGKNVDSWTRPSRWIRIWSVWDTIKIRLFLASRTTLRRHLRHSKTIAQACSSVIGAEKLPVISSRFKQDSWSSWQGDQEVSQNLLSGGEAILESIQHFKFTFHRKQFFRLLARKFCVQLLRLYVKGWVVSKCTLVC